MSIFLQGIFIGLLATVLIDVWALVLKFFFKLPTTNWAMVGRWVGHFHSGQFVHQAINEVEPVASEKALGWLTHYVIGLLYGIAYLWFIFTVLNRTPSVVSAIIFSLVLLVAPWFIMQPGLGLGIFARYAPKPWLTRGINVSVHIVFGIGMYLGWWLLDISLFNL